jgi:AmpD protein
VSVALLPSGRAQFHDAEARPALHVDDDHWLSGAQRRASLNADAREPPGACPELVVIHGISLPPGRFGTGLVEALFQNRTNDVLATATDAAAAALRAELAGLRVSAHLFIDRRGTVTQFVTFDRRAWHAGVSAWRGRPGCNAYSIGIELEGTDTRPYTSAQYRRLTAVLRALLARYAALSPDAIVGHQEIAAGRKSDPGPVFDWRRTLLALAG